MTVGVLAGRAPERTEVLSASRSRTEIRPLVADPSSVRKSPADGTTRRSASRRAASCSSTSYRRGGRDARRRATGCDDQWACRWCRPSRSSALGGQFHASREVGQTSVISGPLRTWTACRLRVRLGARCGYSRRGGRTAPATTHWQADGASRLPTRPRRKAANELPARMVLPRAWRSRSRPRAPVPARGDDGVRGLNRVPGQGVVTAGEYTAC